MLKDNVDMLFLCENMAVMAGRDVHTAYMSSHAGPARFNACSPGSFGGGGCQAVLRLTSQRRGEEARKVQ